MNQSRLAVITLTFFALLFTTVASAQLSDNNMDDLFSDEPSFLPVEEAFVFDFS